MIRRLLAASGLLALAAVAAVLALTATGAPVRAQDLGGDLPPARVAKVAFDPAEARQGGMARITVEIAIDPGFHLYSTRQAEGQRPEFTWQLPAGWTAGKLEDAAEPHEFTGVGEVEWVFEGRALFAQTFTLAESAAVGEIEVRGVADWQICNDQFCQYAKAVPLAAKVKVVAAAEQAGPAAGGVAPVKPPVAPAVPAPAVPAPGGAPAPQGSNTLNILGQAVFWGLLTVLTPCVFPLLPVTVSFFSKQKGPALPRSLVYAFGIVFTITVIGLIFKSGLDVMARGWIFNLFVGVLFLVLSLSLFGLFDLRLPSFLTDWSSSKTGGSGMAGPFFMAVTLALTSFSCSMPFLATMFTQFEAVAQAQAVAGLVVYGSTMALPFFFCSLFPAAIQALPRAGAWMNAVKVTMGFVEFALAFKFLRTVTLNFGWDWLPRGFVLAIWVACAIGAALYLFGYIVLPHDTKVESIGVLRLIFALTFLAAGIYFMPGVQGRKLADWVEAFLQSSPADYDVAGGRGGGNGAAHHEWPKNDWDGALARAKVTGRPVLLDFTGVG